MVKLETLKFKAKTVQIGHHFASPTRSGYEKNKKKNPDVISIWNKTSWFKL